MKHSTKYKLQNFGLYTVAALWTLLCISFPILVVVGLIKIIFFM